MPFVVSPLSPLSMRSNLTRNNTPIHYRKSIKIPNACRISHYRVSMSPLSSGWISINLFITCGIQNRFSVITADMPHYYVRVVTPWCNVTHQFRVSICDAVSNQGRQEQCNIDYSRMFHNGLGVVFISMMLIVLRHRNGILMNPPVIFDSFHSRRYSYKSTERSFQFNDNEFSIWHELHFFGPASDSSSGNLMFHIDLYIGKRSVRRDDERICRNSFPLGWKF